jgi:signal transduction histidine kinase
MVSHDLRSPLANVRISLELLGDGSLGELTPGAAKIVTGAERSIQSLITMINDLLEVKRMELGGLSFDMKESQMQEPIERAVEMLSKEAERRGLRVVAGSTQLRAEVDAERILRVLLNLLGNAIKFAPASSTIKLSCEQIRREPSGKDDGTRIKICVSDEGPGIPPDKAKVIFEKFRQAGTGSAGEKAGTGLGLAICKAIVEAHGGTIGVESEPGKGSTFWFEIPRVQTR